MVDGQLKCIGTPQHLKSKFGKGYQLQITLKKSNDKNIDNNKVFNDIKSELKQFFQVKIIEKNLLKFAIEIIPKNSDIKKLSQMFSIIESIKNNNDSFESYALSQTSLEQIFIKLAKNRDNANNLFDKNNQMITNNNNNNDDDRYQQF